MTFSTSRVELGHHSVLLGTMFESADLVEQLTMVLHIGTLAVLIVFALLGVGSLALWFWLPSTTNKSKKPRWVAILGSQWGDEGKGKITDELVGDYDYCVRFNGGSNAGHTVVVDGVKYFTHVLPSGLIDPKPICVLANGMVISIDSLVTELADLESKGVVVGDRIRISHRAHVVLELHKALDAARNRIGTTNQGIGPAYSARATRIGIRFEDLLRDNWVDRVRKTYAEYQERDPEAVDYEKLLIRDLQLIEQNLDRLRPWIVDTQRLLLHVLENTDQTMLFEGANAMMLDIQFGTYPCVTSSHTTATGIFVGCGLNPWQLLPYEHRVIGVAKAYTTRVGDGDFVTELPDDTGDTMQRVGGEFGVTTGKKRRCGWIDLVQLKYSATVNFYHELNLTKLDVLSEFETLRICTGYVLRDGSVTTDYSICEREEVTPQYTELLGWKGFDFSTVTDPSQLPDSVHTYLRMVSKFVDVPVRTINLGPARGQMLTV